VEIDCRVLNLAVLVIRGGGLHPPHMHPLAHRVESIEILIQAVSKDIQLVASSLFIQQLFLLLQPIKVKGLI
jgi:hypothetical protein